MNRLATLLVQHSKIWIGSSWLISLSAVVFALVLADFGAPSWIFIVCGLWLFSFGLPTTLSLSDTPFPSNPLVFWNRLRPATLRSLLLETNLLERNYRLQQALGVPEEVFARGARLLSLLQTAGG